MQSSMGEVGYDPSARPQTVLMLLSFVEEWKIMLAEKLSLGNLLWGVFAEESWLRNLG